ncbi:MAG TPA: hypothetical protein VGF75_03820 [Candidatus Saccharimonadales bacterium]|jgi:DNA polymerase-4
MEMPINQNSPLIMHIDLNSCFAMMEQQANPLIRHKPVAVAAYDTPKGMILAASYEAKVQGIKLGLSVGQGREIDPGLIVMMPDPDKYFDAHARLKRLLLKYTSEVVSKSVDEYVVDFRGSPSVRSGLSLEEIGRQVKADVKNSLGDYVTVNVGFGSNRFLAKLAAIMNKPDGLTIITPDNLRDIYSRLELVDLPGINVRYEARLNLASIYTPLQFFDASLEDLRRIFRGITGYYWYLRLRGHEIDTVDFKRRSFGNQYALGTKTKDVQELSRLLMKLSEKVGRRIRRAGFSASGVHLDLRFEDHPHWHKGQKLNQELYATQDIYLAAKRLLDAVDLSSRVAHIALTVYGLRDEDFSQLSLFGSSRYDTRKLALAADEVNDRYGEFTLTPALMANMQDIILKRVAFGRADTL